MEHLLSDICSNLRLISTEIWIFPYQLFNYVGCPPIGSMPPPVGMYTAPYVLDINDRFPSD